MDSGIIFLLTFIGLIVLLGFIVALFKKREGEPFVFFEKIRKTKKTISPKSISGVHTFTAYDPKTGMTATGYSKSAAIGTLKSMSGSDSSQFQVKEKK